MVGLVARRFGVLGGTFDPPHVGHLILAEYAADALGLECVWFVPAGDPPHKVNEYKTPLHHRLKMLELAIQDNTLFGVSRVDIDRPGPHYSVDTLRILGEAHPDAELYFVMGGDSLRDLPKWHRAAELIQRCKLAVMRRPGDNVHPNMHDDVLPGLAERVVMIDAPLIDISSTMIETRVREGKRIRYLVPDDVLDYILANKLYRNDSQ
jgi:nicotinate-nucleotide adenylyltransferase